MSTPIHFPSPPYLLVTPSTSPHLASQDPVLNSRIWQSYALTHLKRCPFFQPGDGIAPYIRRSASYAGYTIIGVGGPPGSLSLYIYIVLLRRCPSLFARYPSAIPTAPAISIFPLTVTLSHCFVPISISTDLLFLVPCEIVLDTFPCFYPKARV